MYQGIKVVENFEKWNEFIAKELTIDDLPEDRYYENMGIVLKSSNPKTKMHGIVKAKAVVPLKSYYPCKVKPLNTEQSFGLELLRDDSIPLTTLFGAAGSGKAQPLDALVLTPSGYVTMGSLKKDSKVISSNGKQCKVLNVFPQGQKDIYRITFSDGNTTECCLEHLWWIQEDKEVSSGKWKVVDTQYIKENLKCRKDFSRRNIRIPQTKPITFDLQQNKILDPYLIGVLLGDGSFRNNASISSSDEFIVNETKILLERIGFTLKHRNKYDYAIIGIDGKKSFLKEIIGKLGLNGSYSSEKFIPEEYKKSSIEDRIRLIQGLMDTDGTVSKNGKHCYLSTSSARLCEDFKFVCESLGSVVTVSTRKNPKYMYNGEIKYGKTNYRLSIRFSSNIIPFRLERKVKIFTPKEKYFPTRFIDSIEFIGKKEAQCILVDSDDHSYLTNNFIVTHNTMLACAHALHALNKGFVNKIIIAKSMTPVGREIGYLPGDMEDKVNVWLGAFFDNFEKLGLSKYQIEEEIDKGRIEISPITFIQGRSISNAILVVDEIQNLDMNIIKQIITRAGNNCKVVLLGDPSQRFEGGSINLTQFVDRCKDSSLIGHVAFKKSVRSPLANWAVENL